jgi:5-methyltetrahydrofolate--homocysteine methyltransferase
VREAIHTVFLYHAIQAGMDMGIVNAGMVGVYDDLEPVLRERVEDVVLNRRPDAGERLVEIAETAKSGAKDESKKLEWRGTPEHPKTVGERLSTRWCTASPTSSPKTPKRPTAPSWPRAAARCT